MSYRLVPVSELSHPRPTHRASCTRSPRHSSSIGKRAYESRRKVASLPTHRQKAPLRVIRRKRATMPGVFQGATRIPTVRRGGTFSRAAPGGRLPERPVPMLECTRLRARDHRPRFSGREPRLLRARRRGAARAFFLASRRGSEGRSSLIVRGSDAESGIVVQSQA